MRVLLAIAALALLATFAPLSLARPRVFPARAFLYVERVALDAGDPARRRVGALEFLDGWAMTSNDQRYGGTSAIHIDGGAMLALADDGTLFSHALPDRPGTLPLAIAALETAADKKARDTEAMVVRGDTIWATLERSNAIRRYDRATLERQREHRPAAMRGWYRNSGPEAMVALPRSRVLVVSERSRRGARYSEALLFDGDPTDPRRRIAELAMRRPKDYRITDGARLPDGRVLFLHRRFSLMDGISAKLTVAQRDALRPGEIFDVREIAHFAPPLTTDNFEALAVTREQGRTIIWIASDDNFSGVQRSLLLKFALAE